MKYIFLFAVLFSLTTYGQMDSSLNLFNSSLSKNINIPLKQASDSCYYSKVALTFILITEFVIP
jgi:hypothetical protein